MWHFETFSWGRTPKRPFRRGESPLPPHHSLTRCSGPRLNVICLVCVPLCPDLWIRHSSVTLPLSQPAPSECREFSYFKRFISYFKKYGKHYQVHSLPASPSYTVDKNIFIKLLCCFIRRVHSPCSFPLCGFWFLTTVSKHFVGDIQQLQCQWQLMEHVKCLYNFLVSWIHISRSLILSKDSISKHGPLDFCSLVFLAFLCCS